MVGSIIRSFEVWTDAQGVKSKGKVKSIDNISLEGISRLREFIFTLAAEGYLDKGVKAITTTVGEIAELIMGQAPPGNECNTQGIGTVFVKTGEFGKIYPEKVEWTTKPLKFAKEGDVLICVVGATVGKLNLAINCAIGRSVAAIRPTEKVLTKYLYYCLMPYTLKLRAQSRGSAQGVIGKEELNAINIRVPSIQDQNIIVSRLENLMTLCDKLEEEQTQSLSTHHYLVKSLLKTLTNAPDADELETAWEKLSEHFDTLFCTEDSIDQLKQTILQLAVMGTLVKQNPKDEPASELVKKIIEDKSKLVSAGKLKKQSPLPKIKETEIPFKTPNGWTWERWGNLTNWITYGFTRPVSHIKTGIPIITGKNVKDEKILFETADFTSLEEYDQLNEKDKPKRGDILITKDGTIGRAAIVKTDNPLCINQSVAVLWVKDKPLDKNYLLNVIISPYLQKLFLEKASGVAIKHISVTQFGLMLCPIPPLNEQSRIVEKITELFKMCDLLKNKIQNAHELKVSLSKTIVENAVA